jgi:hypothetical protein
MFILKLALIEKNHPREGVMMMPKVLIFFVPLLALSQLLHGETVSTNQQEPKAVQAEQKLSPFKSFTGKIIGNHVRMRAAADLESHIISEVSKDEFIVVAGEKGDFYAVEPPADFKVYIFRGFVIDDTVVGDRVNVRLFPDREAPVIGHYNNGEPVQGAICKDSNQWLEISPPQNTHFYIAKEFVEYSGKPELKAIHDKRKATLVQLLDSANLLSQSEFHKPFNEIDIERIRYSYQTIIDDYADFTSYAEQATKALAHIQEDYLHRKISFLEAKTSKMGKGEVLEVTHRSEEEIVSATDRMKIWEPVEESLYLTWSAMHHAKTMDDFYADQKLKAKVISGILEAYREPIKQKPGDFILKDKDVPVGFVYSTHINLDDFVGKRVNLIVSLRANNNFAFPAYYVLEVE